jgi:hypothetical protein
MYKHKYVQKRAPLAPREPVAATAFTSRKVRSRPIKTYEKAPMSTLNSPKNSVFTYVVYARFENKLMPRRESILIKLLVYWRHLTYLLSSSCLVISSLWCRYTIVLDFSQAVMNSIKSLLSGPNSLKHFSLRLSTKIIEHLKTPTHSRYP